MCGRFSQYFTWVEIHAFSSLLPAVPPSLASQDAAASLGVAAECREGPNSKPLGTA